MGGGPGGALAAVGTPLGCVATGRRSVEEVEVGMGGGLGGALAGGGARCGPSARWRRSEPSRLRLSRLRLEAGETGSRCGWKQGPGQTSCCRGCSCVDVPRTAGEQQAAGEGWERSPPAAWWLDVGDCRLLQVSAVGFGRGSLSRRAECRPAGHGQPAWHGLGRA